MREVDPRNRRGADREVEQERQLVLLNKSRRGFMARAIKRRSSVVRRLKSNGGAISYDGKLSAESSCDCATAEYRDQAPVKCKGTRSMNRGVHHTRTPPCPTHSGCRHQRVVAAVQDKSLLQAAVRIVSARSVKSRSDFLREEAAR